MRRGLSVSANLLCLTYLLRLTALLTTPLSILTRDRALLGIAGSSTEYITECAEVSRGVSCWRCPSVLLPTAGCWMNAVDAVGLIQISTGAAAQRVRQ